MSGVTIAQREFLADLVAWAGVAEARDLRPAAAEQKSARQTCKRLGWVTFDGHYWRITEAGLALLRSLEGRDE